MALVFCAFRGYLNTYPEKAMEYGGLKLRLEKVYHDDRNAYTSGKETLIKRLLSEAAMWRAADEK